MKKRCSETVFGPRVQSWPCQRAATVQRDGKGYCAQHDPVAQSARNKARRDRFAAREEEHEKIQRRGEYLAARLGVAAHIYYNTLARPPRYERTLMIAFEDVERLLERRRVISPRILRP